MECGIRSNVINILYEDDDVVVYKTFNKKCPTDVIYIKMGDKTSMMSVDAFIEEYQDEDELLSFIKKQLQAKPIIPPCGYYMANYMPNLELYNCNASENGMYCNMKAKVVLIDVEPHNAEIKFTLIYLCMIHYEEITDEHVVQGR
nr:MAG: hypothetical protein [Helarchaeota virus Nidhogg Meg22_1012]URC17469.1 MAG: hypothetical protein [Helarchaeota virus Nidhogg Meg22_1214]